LAVRGGAVEVVAVVVVTVPFMAAVCRGIGEGIGEGGLWLRSLVCVLWCPASAQPRECSERASMASLTSLYTVRGTLVKQLVP
jgi:hypothetical protein